MTRIAVINQKGGVGKTTTVANLGVALSRRGWKVLLIDLDPQAHLTLHLGIDPDIDQPNSYTLVTQGRSILQTQRRLSENVALIPSHINLAGAETELISTIGRETILRDALTADVGRYDYVIIDCPPSLGILTLNALCAAEEVIIPMQAHFLSLQGVSKLLETIQLVHSRINPDLKVSGVLLCIYEMGTRLGSEVLQDLKNFFDGGRNSGTPWADAQVFNTLIHRNIKLAECPSHGLSVFEYAPKSRGASDYLELANEILELHGQADQSTPSLQITAPESVTIEKPFEEAAATAASEAARRAPQGSSPPQKDGAEKDEPESIQPLAHTA